MESEKTDSKQKEEMEENIENKTVRSPELSTSKKLEEITLESEQNVNKKDKISLKDDKVELEEAMKGDLIVNEKVVIGSSDGCNQENEEKESAATMENVDKNDISAKMDGTDLSKAESELQENIVSETVATFPVGESTSSKESEEVNTILKDTDDSLESYSKETTDKVDVEEESAEIKAAENDDSEQITPESNKNETQKDATEKSDNVSILIDDDDHEELNVLTESTEKEKEPNIHNVESTLILSQSSTEGEEKIDKLEEILSSVAISIEEDLEKDNVIETISVEDNAEGSLIIDENITGIDQLDQSEMEEESRSDELLATVTADPELMTDTEESQLKIDEENDTIDIVPLELENNLKIVGITSQAEAEAETIEKSYECVNLSCSLTDKSFIQAPYFILNYFNKQHKKRNQYVCRACYDEAIDKLEDLCGALDNQQPLLLENIPKLPDLVEISDSSDDETCTEKSITQQSEEDQPALNELDLKLIEDELENIISSTLQRVDISKQLSWTRDILEHKVTENAKISKEIGEELRNIQKSADRMYARLYRTDKKFIQEEQPLHIFVDFVPSNDAASSTPQCRTVVGEVLQIQSINTNTFFYAMRQKLLSTWNECVVIEVVKLKENPNLNHYRVRFTKSKTYEVKVVGAKHMAYGEPPTFQLSVGTRVIAVVEQGIKKFFFPGVIAEPAQSSNKFRYLVFFDDGYAQYVTQKNVRVVCEVSSNVWEDVHPSSKDFIKNYLAKSKGQRPMAQVKIGQRIDTERMSKWVSAKVIDIDCSLVRLYFEEEKRFEWIYRGSPRLGPIFRQPSDSKHSTGKHLQKRNEPYVFYSAVMDETQKIPSKVQEQNNISTTRAVAKKSTVNRPAPTVHHMNNSTIFLDDDNNRLKGKLIQYTAKHQIPPKKYLPHVCGPNCLLKLKYDLRPYNPLSKPLLSGWDRKLCHIRSRQVVVYTAPCGRSLRNMKELHKYLRLTNDVLNVDNFDFDNLSRCLSEYVISSAIVQLSDLSQGVENMAISCVNYYDESFPPDCIYSAKRIPTDGVHLNLSEDFLVGCDCTDDCSDKSKCSCWQLTIEGAKYGNPNIDSKEIGYVYKRLPEPVPTGIYECNSRCKCRSNCLNRVVQHPLQLKLQVFKTANRGWGLRCLNDVPKGCFICIYAGHLLTEQKANEGGANFGDEYFAELDYIEVVERLKEGYESDVPEDGDNEAESNDDSDEFSPEQDANKDDSDDEFVTTVQAGKKTIRTRSAVRREKSSSNMEKQNQKKKITTKVEQNETSKNGKENTITSENVVIAISDDEDEREMQNFAPDISMTNENMPNKKAKSVRQMFGKNEDCYIMDAKKMGNIGRYFNHSCSPNLFVQNVFVDTHDLRFPWVAFFAIAPIRSGTELTWNYNYDVGSVPGKVLFCQCGSNICRGRLL